MSNLETDLMPAESLPVQFMGLSCAELDPARFTAAGLSEAEMTSVLGLTTAINYVLGGLNKIADFLPDVLDIAPMRDPLIQVCNRMHRGLAGTDPIGYMLNDTETFLNQTRNGLSNFVVDLKAHHIDNGTINIGIVLMNEGLDIAADHLDELEDVMT